LLQALFALEQAVLSLQQPFLRALRPAAFRLLRLQLLHALLQMIDAALPRGALARQHVAPPILHHLCPLLDALLTLLRPRFDLFLSRRSRAGSGRCARWCSDARPGVSRHRRLLRRCGAMDLGAWRRNAWRGRSRWRSNAWRRVRDHGWALWRGSRTERRRSRPRHGRRCRWTGHGRWWSRRSGCWCSRAPWAVASYLLGERASAHRDRGHTKKKRRNANAAWKHDRNSLLRRPETSTRTRRNRSLGIYGLHFDFAALGWCNSSHPS
jgi:hypothetical protein